MRVEKYMSLVPITIRDDTVYWKAFDIMQEKDLHHIPVVNESNPGCTDYLLVLKQPDRYREGLTATPSRCLVSQSGAT